MAAIAAVAPSWAGQAGSTRQVDPKLQVDRLLATWKANGGANPDALVALGSGASPYLCQLLDARPESLPVEPIAIAVGRLGTSRSIPTLGRLLDSSSVDERLLAVEALRISRQREAVTYLVRAFDDPDESVSSRAEPAVLAASQDSFQVVSVVQQILPKSKDKVRLCRLLGRINTKEADQALLELLGSFDEDDELAALQGLWLRGNPEDGDRVTYTLSNTDSVAVRKEACIVLGKIRYKKATRALIDLLRETDVGLTMNAHWALQQITKEVLKPDYGLWDQWWQRAGKFQGRER
jgi:HEAT repeat protein